MPDLTGKPSAQQAETWQPGVGGVRGLDWEVSHPGRWRAELLWRTTLLAVVYARWRPLLWWRMRRVQPAVVAAVQLGPPTAHARRATR